MNKILAAIAIFAFQVVVLNHLDFSRFIYPQMFILVLIALPPYLSKTVQILIAFGLGLAADLFVSTPGIHASACMFITLYRMWMLNSYDLDEMIANREAFNIQTVSLDKYVFVSFSMVILYHLYAFGLESIGAIHWFNYGVTVLISSAVSLLLIFLIQFLFYRRLGVQ